jgi:acetylornithine deacetylase/succinyl-diaminopimelate desuccinylase-like protein
VPNQNLDDIRDRVIAHLEKYLPLGVKLTISPDKHGALPYQIPSEHVGLKIAAAVLREVYQQPPVYVPMGGTLPVAELLKRLFGLETVFFSFSTADEDFHAPNEFFRLQRLYDGLDAWALYWLKLGQPVF